MKALSRLALLSALVVACSDDAAAPGGSCATGGTADAVNVCDSFFAPSASPIAEGAAVTWTWRGGLQHNVTFEDGQGSSATKNSGTHNRSFSGAGTFRYRCTIHSTSFDNGMVGSVTVQ